MDKDYFFASDVESVTGVKRIRLQQWLKAGYITPSVEKASGHGSRNVFSLNDLFTVELFKRLVESGCTRGWASWIVNNTVGQMVGKKAKDHPYLWFSGEFRPDGRRTAGRSSSLEGFEEGLIEAFDKGHEQYTVIDLSSLVKQVSANVKSL